MINIIFFGKKCGLWARVEWGIWCPPILKHLPTPLLSYKCEGNHSAACGCLTDAFISKAHTNFTSILMEVKSQEFVRRLTGLPKHVRDVHEW